VTGVDISDEAIAFATKLSEQSGIPGKFERSDVYPWLEAAAASERKRYDIAFSSYGALCWLSDLERWMQLVSRILKPGGQLVCLEFHPTVMIFDKDFKPAYDYSMAEPLHWEDGILDYVADSSGGLVASGELIETTAFVNPHPCYEFQRGLGEVVSAVLKSGLMLRELREYPYTNGWKPFTEMKALPGRRWTMPEGTPQLPLMYGLVAVKQ
jgi:SAM-dependent methyltransferase